jgi:T5orf172 domain
VSLGDALLVKIGFTTDFKHRIRSLRTSTPVEPIIHLTIPGTPALERELHARFASLRRAREWFQLSAELQDFIESEKVNAMRGKP